MNKTKYVLWGVLGVVLLVAVAGVYRFNFTDGGDILPPDIAKVSYPIAGATVFGEPVFGDLNGDGKQDAGVLLKSEPGGSGTFYYLVAVVLKDNVYTSTNAILLGDRIAPQNISIENKKLMANYADRGPKDPMTVTPYIGVTKRAQIENGELKELVVLKGRIVWGEGSRTFQPCGPDQGSIESQWIDGKSPALDAIKTTFEREMVGAGAYSPMYAEIVGNDVPVPQDGFGADYKKAISISELLLGSATLSCKRDLIVLENIKSGSYLDTSKTLELKGKARGGWYFEANFPIQVLDRHAKVIANGYATAQGEWMTTEFVPFTSTLTFTTKPASGSFGKIVLKKDNPSDIRAYDDAMEVFVYFK